ncbi:thiamine biosynthesis protein ThiS [Desulfosporosinus acidiphilus SJ4]|uniref:Thiamine biosynthesis protein ThiS n=1 Tax=Desulfosporosinus acidiphilus (strain DSM 22704 / JCM 16185 / SJ4) TaxID=646529 RepID=I4D6K8_DESAJ|nr:sulfur carrier protein ThiS [Desulfosporosinus acidiphilus]AFM41432.1 thiamine biosynthesis protein ThiS [Desulfosporosinus acidiphilus SJ4]
MKITINGEMVELTGSLSLQKWVEEQSIPTRTVIIEYNGEIVPEELWRNTVLKQGDKLEILKFVGGG